MKGKTMKRMLAAIVLTFAFVCQASAAVPPPNVVRVFVEDRDGGLSMGTGTLIRSDLIITNWHVVKDRAGTIRVLFPDWSLYVAEVVKTSKLWDLAVLRIAPKYLPTGIMELGEKPESGDLVVVGGYGPGWYRSDSGRVLRFYMPAQGAANDLIQIGASVRNGDSGGPILKDGKLVGVLFGKQSDKTYGTNVERVRKFLEGVK